MKGQMLLQKEDPTFAQYPKDREDAEIEQAYQKQRELLASVLSQKFDLAVATGTSPLKPPEPAKTPGPEAPAPGQPTEAFIPAQPEQFKSVVAALVPVPITPGVVQPSDGAPGGGSNLPAISKEEL